MCAAYLPWGRHPDSGENCTHIPRPRRQMGSQWVPFFSAKPSEGPARLLLRAGDIASLPGPVSRCRESMNSLFGFNNDCFIAHCAGGGGPLAPVCGSGGAGSLVGRSVGGPRGTQLTWRACPLATEGHEQQQRSNLVYFVSMFKTENKTLEQKDKILSLTGQNPPTEFLLPSCESLWLIIIDNRDSGFYALIAFQVTNVCMVTGGDKIVDPSTLSSQLRCCKGLLAVSTGHAALYLVDLALDLGGKYFLATNSICFFFQQ